MTRATSHLLRLLLASRLIGARAAPGLLCAAAVLIPTLPLAQQPGVFVVVGDSGAAVSANGDGWEQGDLAPGQYLGVAWNGHVFAAVGTLGYVATSEDGRRWTRRTIDPPDKNYFAITAGGSTFVAVGYDVASTSQDGINWTRAAHPAPGSSWGVAWNGSQFVAVVDHFADDNSLTCYIATSPDGSNWTQAWTIPDSADCLWGIAWNGSTFAALSDDGIYTSPNGGSWVKQSTFARAPPEGGIAASNNGTFVIVSEYSKTIITSTNPNGTSWEQKSLDDGVAYQTVGWNGAVFAAVGNGYAATSPDGLVWTPRNPPQQGRYHAIASNGPRTTDLPPPVVTSAAPKAGVTTGGMKVTLEGTGFAAGAEVEFGGVLAKEVTVVDSTKVNVFAPPHAEAEVDIAVRNPDGQTGTLSHGFIYMKASGCGQHEGGSPAGFLGFAAGAWALRRRKRVHVQAACHVDP